MSLRQGAWWAKPQASCLNLFTSAADCLHMTTMPTYLSPTWVRLTQLLESAEVNELHFEGPNRCSIRTGGTLRIVDDCTFPSEEGLIDWCNHLLSSCGTSQRIDGSTHIIETSYDSPSVIARVHIITPPIAASIVVTIAKRSRHVIPLEMLTENGTIDRDIESILRIAIVGRLNCVVAGGTGSGKTTILNAMLSLLDDDERIGVLEEVPELVLPQSHVVNLYNRAVTHLGRRLTPETFLGILTEYAEDCHERAEVVEQHWSWDGFLAYLGKVGPRIESASNTEISLGALVRESVRMRFDRIIIGEVRGPEVVDLLSAMNSGFSGSACTIHANSAQEVPQRLQLLAAAHPAHFSPQYVNSLIAQSVDLVVHLGPPELGQHRVTQLLAIADQVVGETVITTEPLITWIPGEGWRKQGRFPADTRRKLAARGISGI